MLFLWIVLSLACAVTFTAIWGIWGLVRRELVRRRFEGAMLLAKQVEDERKAKDKL